MHGHLSQDTPVDATAAVVWDVYGGLQLGRLVNKLLPDVLGTVEVIEGDGEVGTVVKLTYPPGSPGIGYMIERFTKVDDENRVKETEVIEGGYKALGFDLFRVRLEIIEKESESSIIRSSIEYEVDDKLAEVASHVSIKPLEIMAETVRKHLIEKKTTH
ncbi:S-norcoclaurine synthase 2-like [Durio zibethinus]|uniref:S-norcoclaurine synthase 2-like n=1 Tax=Durio zibethinus TaxID=66656 RepID=A0A6P5WX59_DURZI|nr:S-norcoclaurine synthase 2-like [Durio zibethinus]